MKNITIRKIFNYVGYKIGRIKWYIVKIINYIGYKIGRIKWYLGRVIAYSKEKGKAFLLKNSNIISKIAISILPKKLIYKFKVKCFESKKYQFLIRGVLDFKKAKSRKEYYSKLWSSYIDYPKVSVIVSVFNHDYTAEHIAKKLINNKHVNQIIVLEDGSTDESYKKYKELLNGVNHFILTSNDLNTLRTYDKAIKMSNSEFVVIMQDDDLFPEDGDTWLSQPLELFENFKNLALVGGWNGIDMSPLNEIGENEIDNFPFQKFVDEYGVKTINSDPPFYYKFKSKKKYRDETHDPELDLNERSLQFSPACDIGPYIIRKSYFDEIGGVDFYWGEPGKSSCWWDVDMCYRFWERGYEVINFPMGFHKGQGVIGSDQFYQKQSKMETLESGLRLLLKRRKKSFLSVAKECKQLNKLKLLHKE